MHLLKSAPNVVVRFARFITTWEWYSKDLVFIEPILVAPLDRVAPAVHLIHPAAQAHRQEVHLTLKNDAAAYLEDNPFLDLRMSHLLADLSQNQNHVARVV